MMSFVSSTLVPHGELQGGRKHRGSQKAESSGSSLRSGGGEWEREGEQTIASRKTQSRIRVAFKESRSS